MPERDSADSMLSCVRLALSEPLSGGEVDFPVITLE